MYNVKDNAESSLQVWLSSLATTLVVEMWTGMIFPAPPFIAVLNRRDSDWKITKSEKVEVTAKDWDQFTVNRGFDWDTPQDFNAWDYFSLFVLAKHIQELQERSEYSAKDTAIANEYSNESTYTVWSIVMYKWDRYRCNTAVSTAEEFNPNKWTKLSLQSNLSTIENNVSSLQTNVSDIMTNWVPTIALTKELFVWETYTKGTDKLFLQTLPRAENCTHWLGIWDIDAHKELHIQNAYWEWTSNVIRLKVKRVWSPTTSLIVRVQNWTLYTVSGSERWWTWNWTDIASGSIPYSSITDDWQIFNVTLNQYIWWSSTPTICDIVISQTDWIINADNYYLVAYDDTQFSECFRWIYVNWTSKVASKLMPYISCWGLLNCCAVKYADTSYAFWTSETRDYNHYASKSSWWFYIDIFSEWVTETTYVSIVNPTWVNRWSYSNPYWFDSNYWSWMNFFLEVLNSAWAVVETYQFQYNQSTPVCVTLPVWWRARTKAYTSRTYTWMTAYVRTQTIVSTDWAVNKKNSDWTSIFANEQKSITNIWNFSVVWLVDWPVWPELYKWDFEQTSPFWALTSSATAWSITLPTAVGYLTINVNWTLIKVPYYNL